MFGFVMADFHPGKAAETAANGGNGQQCDLRDAPAIISRLGLVDKHKQEAQRIYYYQVDDDNIHKLFLSEVVSMKKLCFLLAFVAFLAGCRAATTFETVDDVYAPQSQNAPREVALVLPEDVQTIAGDNGKLYLCDGYEVTVETFSSGDLNGTVQKLTGFAPDALTMLQTVASNVRRYECVWTAAGENGDAVGRAVVLDDGVYHYCVTVMGQADAAGEMAGTWQELLRSVQLK